MVRNYVKKIKNVKGISDCTVFGDGSISLILNIEELVTIIDGHSKTKNCC
ncbi:hypothetical protein [Clostridium sp. BJN0013]